MYKVIKLCTNFISITIMFIYEDIIKPFLIIASIIVLIIVGVLAAPQIWENATSDAPEYPYSGFSPECPSWEGDEEWAVRYEAYKNNNK